MTEIKSTLDIVMEKTKGLRLTEEDKEILSAYRVLAHELGYDMGPWRYDKASGTGSAQATISQRR